MSLLAVLLAPVVLFSGWWAFEKQRDLRRTRGELVSNTVEIAVAPYREALRGARRVLSALREDPDVLRWTGDAPDELARCEDYLRRVLRQIGERYALVVVVDRRGAPRCSTSPEPDQRFGALLPSVRDRSEIVVGSQAASRSGDRVILPVAARVVRGGEFQGMVGIAIAWAVPDDTGTGQSPLPVQLTLIDTQGQPIGGANVLPPKERLARAIADSRTAFRDDSGDGRSHEFRLLSFGPNAPLMLAAIPAGAADANLDAPWLDFTLIVLISLLALAAVWLGTGRWCLQPLHPIRRFAAAMARGEDAQQPGSSGPPEIRSLAADIAVMAASIRAREQDLRASLDQRDHMLREIHHRVKNNLQMISSMLSLQSQRIRSPRIRRHFSAAQNRVLALSILHRHLYERTSWAMVDFQAFIDDLVRQISMNRETSGLAAIRLDIRAPVMAVDPDTAIPVGLILTEAVDNAFRHAFGGVTVPAISIQAAEAGGTVEFTIEDNGVGINHRIVTGEDNGGLGLTLIRGLAMQLGGIAEIALKAAGGTRLTIRFPLPT